MKKIILFLGCVFLLVGCKKMDSCELIDELSKKVEKSENYQMIATLDIFRNEEKYSYDVTSIYKKGNFFKVELINKSNNHHQIILKDSQSVYVLTPALNKSFKFQSEWPYNNSQIYLLQPIILDVKGDKEAKLEENNDEYIITSKVNYSNEKDFYKQKIYFSLERQINKIEVVDKSGNVKMRLKIVNLEYDVKLEDNLFDINKYQKKNIDSKDLDELDDNQVSKKIDEIVYPMYVPANTFLTSQDLIDTENGERVILTFSGDSQFTLIQENLNLQSEEGYIYGDPYMISDTIGAITDYSISWMSNGSQYSVVSDTMSVDELIAVAQSLSVEPVGK